MGKNNTETLIQERLKIEAATNQNRQSLNYMSV